jgi:hypothetical protein
MTVNLVDKPYVLFIGRATAAGALYNKQTKGSLIILGQIRYYKIVLTNYEYAERSEKQGWKPIWL